MAYLPAATARIESCSQAEHLASHHQAGSNKGYRKTVSGSGQPISLPTRCVMGMDKYRHTTLAIKEIACRLAKQIPFRYSAEILNSTTSIDLSFQTIHSLVQSILRRSQDDIDQAITWLEQTGELTQSAGRKTDRLMIEADGVVLPLQQKKTCKVGV